MSGGRPKSGRKSRQYRLSDVEEYSLDALFTAAGQMAGVGYGLRDLASGKLVVMSAAEYARLTADPEKTKPPSRIDEGSVTR